MGLLFRSVRGLSWPLAVTLLALAALALLSGRYNGYVTAFNSDDLYLVDFCDDLLAGRDLVGWHLPGAPYLVPDLVLVIPCRLLLPEVWQVFLAYALLYYALVAVALAWLARESGLRWTDAWSAAALGVALLLALHLDPVYGHRMSHLARPGTHLGLVPIGLLLAAFLLRSVRDGFRPLPSLAMLVLAGFTAFSDRLFLGQFLAPAVLMLLLGRLVGSVSTRRLVLAGLLLVGVVALSVGIKKFFGWYGLRFLDQNDQLISLFDVAGMARIARELRDSTRQQHLQYGLSGLFLIVGLRTVVVGLRQCMRGEGAAVLLHGSFALLAALTGLAPLFILGRSPALGFERYCFTLTVVPVVWLVVLGALNVRESWAGWGWLWQVGLATLVVVLLGRSLSADGWPPFEQPYPELVRVLDGLARERGCRRGLAGYWDARRIRYLSREGVCAVQAIGPGIPWFHGCNPNLLLSPDPRDLHVPEFQFVVVSTVGSAFSPVPSAVQLEHGDPLDKVPVGDQEVWVYDRLTTIDFRRSLNSLVATRLEQAGGWTGPQAPRKLAHPRSGYRPRRRSDSVVVLPQGGEVALTFPAVQHSRLIDVSGDPNETFAVTLFQGERALGQASVHPLPWSNSQAPYGLPSVHARLVRVPDAVADEGWDRAVVRYVGERPTAALSHFLAFAPNPALSLDEMFPPSPGRRYPAEALGSQVPSLYPAGGGRGRHAQRGKPHFMLCGPYATLTPGRYRIDFTVRTDAPGSPDALVNLEVCEAGPKVVVSRELRGTDFESASRYQKVSLFVENKTELYAVEFRVLTHGRSAVSVDSVELVPLTGAEAGQNVARE